MGKKNDFITFIVYVAMFAVAILVGLLVISPFLNEYKNALAIQWLGLLIIAVLAGLLFNAILIEIGHVLGAKMGKYKVVSFCVFGLTIKRKDNGKVGLAFGSYEGFTGETKIEPKSLEESSPGAYILMPFVLFVIELIVWLAVISVGNSQLASDTSWATPILIGIIFLTLGGMLFLYDIVPIRLDSINDGWLLMVINKPVNKLAYNRYLLNLRAKERGEETTPHPVYDELTDLTADLNLETAYKAINDKDYKLASSILKMTVDAEKSVSSSRKKEAASLHLGLTFLSGTSKEAKDEYEAFNDEDRKYIAEIPTISACRCYVLISALIDESEAETSFALGKTDRLFKKCSKEQLDAEEQLFEEAVAMVAKAHPGWDLSYIDPQKLKQEEETKEEDNNGEEQEEDSEG